MKKPERPVVLAGIKHCGKSTLGRLLARRWLIPFLDTDTELEREFARRTGRTLTCREIYREFGEQEFRRLEAEGIERLAFSRGIWVVALGGGAVNNPFLSLETLRQLGFGVWIDLRPELAYPRVVRRGLPPFLVSAADPEAEFRSICREREPFFKAFAQLRFPIASERPAEQNAEELALIIEQKGTAE